MFTSTLFFFVFFYVQEGTMQHQAPLYSEEQKKCRFGNFWQEKNALHADSLDSIFFCFTHQKLPDFFLITRRKMAFLIVFTGTHFSRGKSAQGIFGHRKCLVSSRLLSFFPPKIFFIHDVSAAACFSQQKLNRIKLRSFLDGRKNVCLVLTIFFSAFFWCVVGLTPYIV